MNQEALLDADPHLVDAEEAKGMTRAQALRTLAALGHEGAKILLAGPVITEADVRQAKAPRLKPMVIAVRAALAAWSWH